jgi:hypothetical protein
MASTPSQVAPVVRATWAVACTVSIEPAPWTAGWPAVRPAGPVPAFDVSAFASLSANKSGVCLTVANPGANRDRPMVFLTIDSYNA